MLAALVTVGGAWWRESLQRRSAEEFRQRLLSRVKTEVEIIDTWAKAQASLSPTAQVPEALRQQARDDLDQAYQRMLAVDPERRSSVTLRQVLSRLLLRHLHVTRTVRLLRYVYYFLLFMTIIWGLAGFSQPGAWEGAVGILATLSAYVIIAILPAWIVALVVVSISKRHALAAGK
jgi:cation transport ATPase